jgi:hypothetical protein
MKSRSKSSKKRNDPEDWEKVSYEVVCTRLRQVESLANLKDEAIEALTTAICLCSQHPPELGQLITRAKQTITDLQLWLVSNDEFPEFRQYSGEICERLEALRSNVITTIKYMRLEQSLDVVVSVVGERVSPEDVPICHFLVKESPEKTEPSVPEKWALVAAHTPLGNWKGIDEILVLAMGVLCDATGETDPEEALRVASRQTAHLLDTFWARDARLKGTIRSPDNVKKQYNRALKSAGGLLPTHGTALLIDMHRREDPAVKHAWLPVRRQDSD